ncbi:MAG: hypothetical protein M1827_000703 [Pycnora praestabilis]|nr:MAG: hypothetical protein M1827_000703 [Pycnora praestabilis]
MAAIAPQQHAPSTSSRSSSVVNGSSAAVNYINGNGDLPPLVDLPNSNIAPPAAPLAPAPKKGKGKKAADPNETSKLLAAKINQLESDAAGEKDHEAEIDREVKKSSRDLNSQLSTIDSPLSRLEVVHKKYLELLADMKRLDRDHVKSKKRGDQLQKEKDQGRSELSKTISLKEKLEKLCRELTRENKKMKEEQKRLEETEKKSRAELNDRLTNMAWEVHDVVGQKEHPEGQHINMETDELFRQKFRSFIDQYELRELHFHSLLRTKELEVQYNMARYEQQKKAAEQETARSRALSGQVSTFSKTETELRSQLNIYVEKFKQVEDTLNNSNDLFLTFRKEMEEMSKKTKRLEKENLNLTRKHDATNRNILEMAEERTRVNKELEMLRKKNGNLEKLCRGMQAQGRGQATAGELGGEDEGTESDYEYDDEEEDEEGSEEGDYDDDTEEDALHAAEGPPTFGPVPPPPPPPPQIMPHGRTNGEVNGVKH